MATVRSHRDLIVWRRAMDLTVAVYELARCFPKTEQYGITSQITRSAASVPANIAEGKARATTRDYVHFLSIARGSLMETETFLILAIRLGFISEQEAQPALCLVDEVGRMINTIRVKLIPNP